MWVKGKGGGKLTERRCKTSALGRSAPKQGQIAISERRFWGSKKRSTLITEEGVGQIGFSKTRWRGTKTSNRNLGGVGKMHGIC